MQDEQLEVLSSDAEYAVELFAQSAKAYWRAWGPLGDLMVRSVDTWAEMQRAYVQWLRQSTEVGDQP